MVIKFDKNLYLNHISEADKRIILRRVIDKIEITMNKHINTVTDFLDPYELHLAKSILNKFDEISYQIQGGYDLAERNIVCIYPCYINDFDQNVKKLSFKVSEKISHKNILGTLISLGIDRNKIGDIVFSGGYWHIFLKDEIFKYVQYNLDRIGKNKISFEKEVEFMYPEIEYSTSKLIISSLRLDAFVSSVLKISRSTASELVTSKKVKVNFKEEIKPSQKVNVGDLISVRKYGRIIFENIEKRTQKDKYVINIKVPK